MFLTLFRWEAYTEDAIWIGFGDKKCTNSKLLFNSIVGKLENLIFNIKYNFFHGEIETNPNIWHIIDHQNNGRCFMAIPTQKMISKGIKNISVKVLADIKIIFLTPGTFLTSRTKSQIKLKLGKKVDLKLIHQVYNMLDYGGKICNHNPNYSKDFCSEEMFEKKVIGTSISLYYHGLLNSDFQIFILYRSVWLHFSIRFQKR